MKGVGQVVIKLPPTIARGFIMALVRHIDVDPYRDVEEVEVRGDSVILKGPDPVNGLREAINLVADYVANQVKIGARVRIPMSGNDRRILSNVFQCYQASPDASPDHVIRQIGSHIYTVKCDSLRLPSLLKPELYEYTRIPGYLGEGERRFDEEYPVESIALAIIGYLGAKVGAYYVRGEGRAVALLPPDEGGYNARYFLERYSKPLRNMWNKQADKERRMVFPGISPEPALIIWLALQLPEADKINVVSLKEPAGQEPATISSYLSLSLESVRINPSLWNCIEKANEQGFVDRILRMALNPNPEQRSDLAAKASLWLYEALVGARQVEEALYVMSRNQVSALLTGSEASNDARYLASLAKSIYLCRSTSLL